MGPAWRHMRTDRDVVNDADRPAARSAGSSASPARTARTIAAFLALTVIDAGLVVVTPLLVQRIVDDGILKGDHGLVTLLALAWPAVALLGRPAVGRSAATSPRASARA